MSAPLQREKATDGICKHRLAVMIHKRANQEATALLERRRADRPADIAPALSTEATISMNTRIIIGGRPVQITVRTSATVDDCRRIMVVMQEVLAEHSDTPTLVASMQAPLCPVHTTAMQVSKCGGYYCPRKNADGSPCKQKAAA